MGVYGFEWWLNDEVVKVDAILWSMDYFDRLLCFIASFHMHIYVCIYACMDTWYTYIPIGVS